MTQITDNAEGKFELWFFRDMNDAQRLKLFSLFGLPTDEVRTLGAQKLVLRRILSALSSPGKDGGQEVEAVARWLVEEELPSGSKRWEVFEHELHARNVAARYNHRNKTTVTPLYARPQPASTALVDRLRVAIHNALIDGPALANDGQSEFDRAVDTILAGVQSALSASQSTSREGER